MTVTNMRVVRSLASKSFCAVDDAFRMRSKSNALERWYCTLLIVRLHRVMFGKINDPDGMGEPSCIPTLAIEFFSSAFWFRFHVQRMCRVTLPCETFTHDSQDH
jgi:hypothetical protein